MGSRREPDEEIVWCFDADSGEVLWHVSYFAKFDARADFPRTRRTVRGVNEFQLAVVRVGDEQAVTVGIGLPDPLA